ncbi:imidazole glycerol phosphate synthase subunit HisF [Actinomadura sp. KC216]|uniref:HisA/HisF-related TIM barrel protein n=1 Tax=Actinomadura sp. KC216 TaxID=2530370 RepID=UPI001043734C|nr:HisA/HisF-related TIM barrel protein [Actinomadura sp. KC216]TDB83002.1 imidazole glycerol phosphate synthase subunit HisF [Actinomadura sp. KC216]
MPRHASQAGRGSPVIPTIDIAQGRAMRPSKITDLDDPCDPVEISGRYRDQGVRRVFLDVQEPWEHSDASLAVVERVGDIGVAPWVTVANGVIPSVDAVGSLLDVGADAVGISTTSVERPSMLHTAAQRFGVEHFLGVMNVQRTGGGRWDIVIEGGRTPVPVDAVTWARMLTDLGAGFVLPNSIDQEGTGEGYDLDLVRSMAGAVSVPVIASGGCGTLRHLRDAIVSGADYVLTQRMLHDGIFSAAEADAYIHHGHADR